MIFGNQGFLGVAIIYLLFSERGIMYVTFFNICYLIWIWSYGIYLFTKRANIIQWKPLVLNPGILSTSIGTMMLFLPYNWPTIIIDTFETVGKMTIPLSMLLIGSLLSEINRKRFQTYCFNRYIWLAAIMRLIVLPSFLIIFYFFSVPFPLLVIAILTFATPSASTTSLYAQKFGADSSFASFGVFITTTLCVVTIPFIYLTIPFIYFLLRWMETIFIHP